MTETLKQLRERVLRLDTERSLAAAEIVKLIRAQQAQIERAKEALGFYADKENYMPQCAFRTPISGNYGSNIQVNDNNGDRARAALAAISDEQTVMGCGLDPRSETGEVATVAQSSESSASITCAPPATSRR